MEGKIITGDVKAFTSQGVGWTLKLRNSDIVVEGEETVGWGLTSSICEQSTLQVSLKDGLAQHGGGKAQL